MAVVEESVFLVAVGKVTPVLEGVNVKVASTSIAVVEVATALEVVDVIVAVLEVVVNKVAPTSVAIVSGTRSSQGVVGQDACSHRPRNYQH